MKLKTVVMPLIVINVVFFILQMVLDKIGIPFTQSLMLVGGDVFTRPWILVTSMFLHSGIGHIFFNMYVLLMFGALVEQRIGGKRFLFIYFLSGIAASFLSSFFYASALGASGAIMGIMGVIIMLMPDLKVLFFFLIPMPLWIAAIVIALMDVFGVFFPSGIGNIAHLVGMAVGLLYGIYLKKEKIKFQSKFTSKTHLDVDDLEEYVKTGRI
ncbi:MAG: rhomboid family intramembrane serine protease [Nanoarchaeota archaeon]